MHREKYEQCSSNSYSVKRKYSQSSLKRQSVIKLPNLHVPVIVYSKTYIPILPNVQKIV